MDKIKQYLDTNELTITNLTETIYILIRYMEEEPLKGDDKKHKLIQLLKTYSKDEQVDDFIEKYIGSVIDTLVFVSNNPMRKKLKFLCCL